MPRHKKKRCTFERIFFWKNHIEQSTYIAYNKATVSETSNRIIFSERLEYKGALHFLAHKNTLHFLASQFARPWKRRLTQRDVYKRTTKQTRVNFSGQWKRGEQTSCSILRTRNNMDSVTWKLLFPRVSINYLDHGRLHNDHYWFQLFYCCTTWRTRRVTTTSEPGWAKSGNTRTRTWSSCCWVSFDYYLKITVQNFINQVLRFFYSETTLKFNVLSNNLVLLTLCKQACFHHTIQQACLTTTTLLVCFLYPHPHMIPLSYYICFKIEKKGWTNFIVIKPDLINH